MCSLRWKYLPEHLQTFVVGHGIVLKSKCRYVPLLEFKGPHLTVGSSARNKISLWLDFLTYKMGSITKIIKSLHCTAEKQRNPTTNVIIILQGSGIPTRSTGLFPLTTTWRGEDKCRENPPNDRVNESLSNTWGRLTLPKILKSRSPPFYRWKNRMGGITWLVKDHKKQ